jgi:hypothetical protein
MVDNRTIIKEVTWSSNSIIDTDTEESLSQIADFIIDMISEKPEMKMLPPANGGYL